MFARVLILTTVALLLWAMFAHESGALGPERHYRVRAGDTLWSIAVTHYAGDPREAIWRLQRRNNLESAAIAQGQRLVLP